MYSSVFTEIDIGITKALSRPASDESAAAIPTMWMGRTRSAANPREIHAGFEHSRLFAAPEIQTFWAVKPAPPPQLPVVVIYDGLRWLRCDDGAATLELERPTRVCATGPMRDGIPDQADDRSRVPRD